MDQHNKLHPPISTESREPGMPFYITSVLDPTALSFTSFDIGTESIVHDNYVIKDVNAFFNENICNVATFVFNMFELQHSNFCRELKRQESLIKILRRHKTPYCFMRTEEIFATMTLVNAKSVSKVGDVILLVCVILDELIVLELERKARGYLILERRDVDCENEIDYGMLKNQILGSSKPSKIIVSPVMATSNRSLTELVRKKILKNENITVMGFDYEKNTSQFMAAVVDYIYDKNVHYWHVFPRSHSSYIVSKNALPTSEEDASIVVRENDTVPLAKSCLVPRKSNSKLYLSFFNDQKKKYEHVRTYEPLASTKSDYHKVKVTFIIDESNMPFLYQEKADILEIEGLTSKLNKTKDLDIPVIGFFDNSAVICIKKDNKYKFLDSWNGKYGNEIFLSFHQEKPVLINDLTTADQTKTILKAYDIFKVMSMPCENITIDEEWNFEITSDDENPVLLSFKNFDDSSVASHPAFLMALIIKEFKKMIKKEIGESPKKIGILHFDEFDEDAKKKRIEHQLQEACSLLHIESQIV